MPRELKENVGKVKEMIYEQNANISYKKTEYKKGTKKKFWR